MSGISILVFRLTANIHLPVSAHNALDQIWIKSAEKPQGARLTIENTNPLML